jgi:hypothetical protein
MNRTPGDSFDCWFGRSEFAPSSAMKHGILLGGPANLSHRLGKMIGRTGARFESGCSADRWPDYSGRNDRFYCVEDAFRFDSSPMAHLFNRGSSQRRTRSDNPSANPQQTPTYPCGNHQMSLMRQKNPSTRSVQPQCSRDKAKAKNWDVTSTFSDYLANLSCCGR